MSVRCRPRCLCATVRRVVRRATLTSERSAQSPCIPCEMDRGDIAPWGNYQPQDNLAWSTCISKKGNGNQTCHSYRSWDISWRELHIKPRQGDDDNEDNFSVIRRAYWW